ncbi:metallophosphoesterase family protein [Kaarinaea lacus]
MPGWNRQDAGIELAGRKIFIVHYPHYARAMGATGDWDLVCCGHDHRAEIDSIPNVKQTETLFINPGTVAGVGAPPTYVIGNLVDMVFEVISVPVDSSLAYNMPHVTKHD